MSICMKAAMAIGLVFAFVLGMMALLQISNLQDEGESLGNNVGPFFQQITSISTIIIVAVLGAGTFVAAIAAFVKRR